MTITQSRGNNSITSATTCDNQCTEIGILCTSSGVEGVGWETEGKNQHHH